MRRRPVVIAYDISSNKRRRRMFSLLKRWKLDAQYSVFECRLTEPEAKELFMQLASIMDTKTDSLLLAWLDRSRKAVGWTQCSLPGFRVPVWYMG